MLTVKIIETSHKPRAEMKNLLINMQQVKKKQSSLEHDRAELARICQMLIDELNECKGRVEVAEAVIGDLKNTGKLCCFLKTL